MKVQAQGRIKRVLDGSCKEWTNERTIVVILGLVWTRIKVTTADREGLPRNNKTEDSKALVGRTCCFGLWLSTIVIVFGIS